MPSDKQDIKKEIDSIKKSKKLSADDFSIKTSPCIPNQSIEPIPDFDRCDSCGQEILGKKMLEAQKHLQEQYKLREAELQAERNRDAENINECFSDLAGTVPAKPGDKVAAMKIGPIPSLTSPEWLESVGFERTTLPRPTDDWYDSTFAGNIDNRGYFIGVEEKNGWVTIFAYGRFANNESIHFPTIKTPDQLLQLMGLLGIPTTATKQ